MITKTNIGSVNCRPSRYSDERAPAVGERHEQHEHDRPEAEHRLDLAEQVPDAGMRGAGMRQVLEVARGEGMHHGEREERGAGNLERANGHGSTLSAAVPGCHSEDDVRETTYLRCTPRDSQDPILRMKLLHYLRDAAVFAPCYVLLDWVSYIHPLGPFNITPWNPQPALAIAWMLLGGLVHAPGRAGDHLPRRRGHSRRTARDLAARRAHADGGLCRHRGGAAPGAAPETRPAYACASSRCSWPW